MLWNVETLVLPPQVWPHPRIDLEMLLAPLVLYGNRDLCRGDETWSEEYKKVVLAWGFG